MTLLTEEYHRKTKAKDDSYFTPISTNSNWVWGQGSNHFGEYISPLDEVKFYMISLKGDNVIQNESAIPYISYFELRSPKIKIHLELETIAELPNELYLISEEIEKSKYILELEDDWDGDGGISYKKSTWTRAIKFLTSYSKSLFENNLCVLNRPKIYHSENGSIDILWKNESYRLLINIPQGEDSPATFYGDDYDSERVKGTFNPNKINKGLLLCLQSI